MGFSGFTILTIDKNNSSRRILKYIFTDDNLDEFISLCQELEEEDDEKLIRNEFQRWLTDELLEDLEQIFEKLIQKFRGLALNFYVFNNGDEKTKYTYKIQNNIFMKTKETFDIPIQKGMRLIYDKFRRKHFWIF